MIWNNTFYDSFRKSSDLMRSRLVCHLHTLYCQTEWEATWPWIKTVLHIGRYVVESNTFPCEVWPFHSGFAIGLGILGFDSVSFRQDFPSFRRIVLLVSSKSNSLRRMTGGTAWAWRWSHFDPSKRRNVLTQRHCVTSEKIRMINECTHEQTRTKLYTKTYLHPYIHT